MGELVDASPLLGHRSALVERFRDDGHLFFRSLLPRSEVLSVRTAILGVLTSAGWTTDSCAATVEPVNEGDEAYFPVYERIQALEVFHLLAHHPALVDLMGCLLGAEVVVHPRKVARVSFPENPFGTTPSHQDFPLIQGTTDVLTCWIPLGDCSLELGGLKVLAGSHRDGLRTGRPFMAVGRIGVQIPPHHPDWRSTDFLAGDALVFHSLTIHGARPNKSSAVRLSADFRYQSSAEPMVPESLHPHYHPPLADWPVLCDGWTSTAPIDSPPGVPTVPYVVPTEPLLPGPSRFVKIGSDARPGVVVP